MHQVRLNQYARQMPIIIGHNRPPHRLSRSKHMVGIGIGISSSLGIGLIVFIPTSAIAIHSERETANRLIADVLKRNCVVIKTRPAVSGFDILGKSDLQWFCGLVPPTRFEPPRKQPDSETERGNQNINDETLHGALRFEKEWCTRHDSNVRPPDS